MMTPPVRITVTNRADTAFSLKRTFARTPIRIGRQGTSDLELAFPYISSRQAELREGPAGELILHDLGAHNSMAVDNQPIPRGGEIRVLSGQVVVLGPLELRIEYDICQSGVIGDDGSTGEGRAREAVEQLRSLHTNLAGARRRWEDALSRIFEESNDDGERQIIVSLLTKHFPESDWSFIVHRDSVLLDDPLQAAFVGHLRELAPHLPPPVTVQEAERALGRMADGLRAFTTSALQLHRVLHRRLTSLGSQAEDPANTFVHGTRDDLLAAVLDWRELSSPLSTTLARGLSAQVEDVEYMMDSAIEVLHEILLTISPSVIENGTGSRWPSRAAALWNAYSASFQALVGDAGLNVPVAFREAFAAAIERARRRVGGLRGKGNS